MGMDGWAVSVCVCVCEYMCVPVCVCEYTIDDSSSFMLTFTY